MKQNMESGKKKLATRSISFILALVFVFSIFSGIILAEEIPEHRETGDADVSDPMFALTATSNQILINEIMFDPMCNDSGKEWIELYNDGAGVQNLNGWTISNRSGEIAATLPNWDFSNGTYLVVHFYAGTNDNDFSDGSGSFYTGINVEVFKNIEDECALYNGPPSSSSIVDFVSWCSHGSYSGSLSHGYAVNAGIWDSGDYLDTYLPPVSDIGRDKYSTDTNQPDDWLGNGGINADGPTPGKDNDAFNIYDQSIRGTVVDTNGVPIPGARITVNGTSIEVYSDNNGTYNITNAPVGIQTLFVSKDGYVSTADVVEVFYDQFTYFHSVLTPLGSATSIGPSGGVVYGSDGTIVTIPPGALDITVNITITPLPPEAIPITMNEFNNWSYLKLNGLNLGPDNLTFNLPVTVSFPLSYLGYDPNNAFNLSEGDILQVALFDPVTLMWSEYVNATVNEDNISATMQVTHFSTTTTTSNWWKLVSTMSYRSYPPLKYLTQCLCKEGGANGVRSCAQGQYTREHTTSVSATSSLSIDVQNIAAASVGVTIGESIKEIWKSPEFESANCYDKELYGQWKGQRYVVKVYHRWPFLDWYYMGRVIIDEPTGPEHETKQKDNFKKDCDQCCRKCDPDVESEKGSITITSISDPDVESNCKVEGKTAGELTVTSDTISAEDEAVWVDDCTKTQKIEHKVKGTAEASGKKRCYCNGTKEWEDKGTITWTADCEGQYTETKTFKYLCSNGPTLSLQSVPTNNGDGKCYASQNDGKNNESSTKNTDIDISGHIYPPDRAKYNITIDSSISRALFMIYWSDSGSNLNLILNTPSGIVDPSVAAEDLSIDYKENALCKYYRIQYPEKGNWSLNVNAVNVPREGLKYNAMVYMISDIPIYLSISTNKDKYTPKDSIDITANLRYNNAPLTGASIITEILKPDGTMDKISLFDDGSHSDVQANDGMYSNTYTNTNLNGTYYIIAHAVGPMPTCDGFAKARSKAVTVRVPTAEFNDTYSDYGSDTDGDGLYDNLTIDVGVNVTVAGNYSLEGLLYDVAGISAGASTNSTHVAVGNQTIKLNFDGKKIRKHGIDGPYYLRSLILSSESSEVADYIYDAYITSAYNHTDFQAPSVEFTTDYTDYGIDTDGDGLYDYLTIDVGVNVITAGNYSLMGYLYDVNGTEIVWSIDYYGSLDVGNHTMHLDFNGKTIQMHGVNGPYYLKHLKLSGENWTFIDRMK
jgi:hypothetical protein